MKTIGDWFSRGSQSIILGTAFTLLVLVGLVVTPIITSELAIGAHSHIRESVEPLDEAESQLVEPVARMEGSFLRYVCSRLNCLSGNRGILAELIAEEGRSGMEAMTLGGMVKTGGIAPVPCWLASV